MSYFNNRSTAVFLNVYDLIPINDLFTWVGFGIFHSGVEVHGSEWSFGGGEQFKNSSQTGVFSQQPRKVPEGYEVKFRESVKIFETNKTSREIRRCVETLQSDPRWQARNYHVLENNCNHFTNELIKELSDEQYSAPSWLNRPAKTGSWFIRCLPCCDSALGKQQQQQKQQTNQQSKTNSSFQFGKYEKSIQKKSSLKIFKGKGNKLGKKN
ncbi:hypothetical protein M0813_21732 [Anaeramoeba flamelloides]|uniref:PPPDE domain-containing protein n=1 Tax=Anaeramoeba flamelloides TaxID=1746091 RepID=A0ABQ8YH96_9EUKA|nr:hypothetical protein M0813_21732 [Anaeramoeba flamelloides]